MTTTELLEQFIMNTSDDESIEKLIFLQDTTLCQGLVAWKNMNVRFEEDEIDFSQPEAVLWNKLWDYCEFDLEDFAVLIGKKYSEAEDVLKRLVFMKFIYPDGRVDKIALSYTRNVSKNMISKMFSKSKKSGEDKK